jgi:hypothetical protein
MVIHNIVYWYPPPTQPTEGDVLASARAYLSGSAS